jgi:hypothetical protein
MSIEELARSASADLAARTSADVDAGLEALLVTHTRRRRQARVALSLAAAAAVAVAWWGGASFGHHPTRLEPAPSPSPTVPTIPAGPAVCAEPLVTCRGHRTYRFALARPVQWRIPRGYGVNSGAGASSTLVESYSRTGPGGVTVMEGVRAASRDSRLAAGVPPTAEGFVRWVAHRPYVRASAVRRTTFDGLSAWQVRVAVRPHRGGGPGRCGEAGPAGYPCHPITFQSGAITGVWADMTADYTAVDVPGSGTLVVWSWAFGHDTATLRLNQRVVHGLSLPRG